ncbi:tissue factor pathway inhibitor-like [Scleropages formosus]|uniref:Tissue factor pathway inhibitor n=1 Tax=Scleropages formosus TaxID=113540 RepID=A0A8C9RUA4_SCLFO|nr:tissue factor pathway inhibitor-like [Scleropages formosus]
MESTALVSSVCLLLSVALVAPSGARLRAGEGEWPELRLFHHSCALKKDEGPCKALVERFYFDVETGGCERFDYGGCQGNANNFESLQKCEDMCLVRQDKSPCHLEEETGPCRGMVLRYFYSMASRRCERFFYGGCFGNANNFRTEEACRARCHGNSMETPSDTRAGADSRARAQDVESSDVLPQNASHTQAKLPKATGGAAPAACQAPIHRGTCGDAVKRYGYNAELRRCQSFRYSGCGGNSNNFESKKECVRTCIRDVNPHAGGKKQRAKPSDAQIIFRSV